MCHLFIYHTIQPLLPHYLTHVNNKSVVTYKTSNVGWARSIHLFPNT